ncbi:glycosyl transferase family 2 [Reticulomyxa filosa]|uniref:Glycosyl transferase family 2 n=1 Tax=Reticulomyxa filosa TaxID=46433 RepID=X6NNL7_RETFI|nr:glycosyl transferase family 2 [Reticulomyxa filosa]|eukprot:ETO27596.1 glycosyl transferase family 2 [Reticulomyxa filosa]
MFNKTQTKNTLLKMAFFRHKSVLKILLIGGLFHFLLLIFGWSQREGMAIMSYNAIAKNPQCHVGVVSTYPPSKCGVAEFSKEFVASLRANERFRANCTMEVLALSTGGTMRMRKEDEIVTRVWIENDYPSKVFWEISEYVNTHGFTHVILEHEFGLTPNVWQYVDFARWLHKNIELYTVVHSPKAYPSVIEMGVIRQLSKMSKFMVVMSWHAHYSFVHAYGIPKEKVLFIPHGIKEPQFRSSERPFFSAKVSALEPKLRSNNVDNHTSGSDLPFLNLQSSDIVVLSNGLIRSSKGLIRMIRNLPKILEKVPNLYFFIIGEEHPNTKSKHHYMESLLKYAASIGVSTHVVWINEYVTEQQLAKYFGRTDIYVTLFDEIVPVSGTLLTAMSYGLPVISTPYRFAVEILSNGTGIIVPYEDDTKFIESVIAMAKDMSLRRQMGKKAQAFVLQWKWNKVANQFASLILNRAFINRPSDRHVYFNPLGEHQDHYHRRDQYNNNRAAKGPKSQKVLIPYYPLTLDPFQHQPKYESFFSSPTWSPFAIRTFDEQLLRGVHESEPDVSIKHPGVYALYVDNFVQINCKIEQNTLLSMVGIKTHSRWIYVHDVYGIDYRDIPMPINWMKQNKSDGIEQMTINWDQKVVVVASINVKVHVQIVPSNGIAITFSEVNRFASPRGLLGDTLRCRYDESIACPKAKLNNLKWREWHIPSDHLFDHKAAGQHVISNNITTNILDLPVYDLSSSTFKPVPSTNHTLHFVIEGPLFTQDSIAKINRQMWLMLQRYPNINVLLKPTDDISIKDSEMYSSLDIYLAFCYFAAQPYDNSDQFLNSNALAVIFRHERLPNFQTPEWPPRYVYIHQQPWEFGAIPEKWLYPLQYKADELWVPFTYFKQAYTVNGINPDKISVIPQGVDYQRIDKINGKFDTNTSKTFKFLFVGKQSLQKGIDILLNVYRTTFTRKDDVTLILLLNNNTHEYAPELERTLQDPNAPELVVIRRSLSTYELSTLIRSCNVFVSPYRTESFGLTILEAMAAAKPVIVTRYGISNEFCTEHNAFFINADVTNCFVAPCGNRSIFGQSTRFQPQWSEPDIHGLARAMKLAYTDTALLKKKGGTGRDIARKHGWEKISALVIQRVYQLVKNKLGVEIESLKL